MQSVILSPGSAVYATSARKTTSTFGSEQHPLRLNGTIAHENSAADGSLTGSFHLTDSTIDAYPHPFEAKFARLKDTHLEACTGSPGLDLLATSTRLADSHLSGLLTIDGGSYTSCHFSSKLHRTSEFRVDASIDASIVEAVLTTTSSLLTVGPAPSGRTLAAYISKEGNLVVTTGCFLGSTSSLRTKARKTHLNNSTSRDYYLSVADFIDSNHRRLAHLALHESTYPFSAQAKANLIKALS